MVNTHYPGLEGQLGYFFEISWERKELGQWAQTATPSVLACFSLRRMPRGLSAGTLLVCGQEGSNVCL